MAGGSFTSGSLCSDVRRLSTSPAPFSWATYSCSGGAISTSTRRRSAPPAGRDVGDVGWRGNELVAFRMHLPARILYHDAPSKQVERGNILVWEQSLADRLKGTPVHIEARMEGQSILYSDHHAVWRDGRGGDRAVCGNYLVGRQERPQAESTNSYELRGLRRTSANSAMAYPHPARS